MANNKISPFSSLIGVLNHMFGGRDYKPSLPWPDGAKTIEIEILRVVVVRCDGPALGPWLKVEPGSYTLVRRDESSKIYDAPYTAGGYLIEQQWKLRMNGGYFKVVSSEK